MTIVTNITTQNGSTATVHHAGFTDFATNLKELINELIDLHKELSGSDEIVQVRLTPEEIPNSILQDLPFKEVTAEQAHVPTERTPLPTTSTTSETDIDGIPWDARIHSSGKSRTNTGQWTKRKKLPEGVYESVLAEIKSQLAPVQAPSIPAINLNPAPQETPTLTEPALITVNYPGGQAQLTPREYEKFQGGYPVAKLLAERNSQPQSIGTEANGISVQQIIATAQIPPVNLNGPQPQALYKDPGAIINQVQPSSIIPDLNSIDKRQFTSVVVPMYDAETFQKSLPNVLSELFNKGLINSQVMMDLGNELQVPQLWMVMQDKVKCGQLYNTLGQRGIIQTMVQ